MVEIGVSVVGSAQQLRVDVQHRVSDAGFSACCSWANRWLDGRYDPVVDLFFAHAPDGSDLFGAPVPALGARVVFVPELLFAAQEHLRSRPVPHELVGDEGLVVHEDAREVLTWPCRLWRVEDVEGVVRLRPENRWFRCKAMTVVEELPAWQVLGAHGDSVVSVMEQARWLTAEQVHHLAAIDHGGERRLYEAVWNRWLAVGGSGSPVGRGLSLVNSAVDEAARRTDCGLFAWDEADEVEFLADPGWQQAGRAAAAAALALGAPELFSSFERDVAARRWTTVFGRPQQGD
ncbi:MAG: hypothetical protein DLM55_03700 [Acidimicrobiales bacterium]|nr:MAG: hypothetical protein DLM55_03700 [Acidimicrobiales bacterium]